MLILSENPGLKIKELHDSIAVRFHASYSFQATDKAAKKLVSDGILIVKERKYYINPGWALALKEFSEKVYSSTQEKLLFEARYLSDKKEFNNLVELDNFLSRIVGGWINNNSSKPVSVIVLAPHCFWLTSNIDRDHPFVHIIANSKIKIFYLNTRDTYLDHELTEKFYAKQGALFRFDKRQNNLEYAICFDSTILYFKLPDSLAKDIDLLYSKKAARVPIEKLRILYEKKSNITLSTINDKALCEEFKKRFPANS
jgi:hypothetical protein